jgi:hypothetical protein
MGTRPDRLGRLRRSKLVLRVHFSAHNSTTRPRAGGQGAEECPDEPLAPDLSLAAVDGFQHRESSVSVASRSQQKL